VVLACATSPARSWSTSAASACRAATDVLPLLAPCRPSSRARRTDADMPLSAVSTVAIQPRPFSALRANCSCCCTAPRSRIAVAASVGESEGRLTIRPVESCSCTRARRDRLDWSWSTELLVSIRWVTRIVLIAGARCG
jgi:hypothetical protein